MKRVARSGSLSINGPSRSPQAGIKTTVGVVNARVHAEVGHRMVETRVVDDATVVAGGEIRVPMLHGRAKIAQTKQSRDGVRPIR